MYKILVSTLFVLTLLTGCSMKEYTLFQDENRSMLPTDVNASVYTGEMTFENRVQPNDRLGIMVYNQLSGSGEMNTMLNTQGKRESQGLLVTKEGTIRLPLTGNIKVIGLTEDEAARKLMKSYSQYLRNSYVTVDIMNQRLIILGEVQNPGVVPVTNGTMNLIEALARSGDLTDYAERRGILILRGDLRNPEVRTIDLTKMSHIKLSSLYLKPNDIVYVQPRDSKGRQVAFDELSPPFQLISSMLQPFVSMAFLANAWAD